MPKDLAALLVDEGVVAAKEMERALERQFEAGGALDSALLELGLVDEERLVQYLARAAELPAAPDGAWSEVDSRARRVFPSKVAERHGLAPFALDGRELSLVATYPVDLGLLDEISFMLSLHLTPHVGPEHRVRALIHRLYGSPLPARLAALGSEPGAAPPARAADARDAGDAGPSGEARPSPAPTKTFTLDAAEPEPLAAALAAALDDIDITVEESEPEQPAAAPAVAPPAPEAAPAESTGPAGLLAAEPPGEPEREPSPPALDRSAPPRWNLEDARAALDAAVHRDAVVLAALRYARDFFDYAAVFAVTRDAIVGHDALGGDDARERARATALYAADPGIFRTVLQTCSPHLGPVDPSSAGNAAILSGLGRGAPRTVLVFPALLRDRPVCILYADNGEAPVSARRLGDLFLFLSTIGMAFERILRTRKERSPEPNATPPPTPPPTPTSTSTPTPTSTSTPTPAPTSPPTSTAIAAGVDEPSSQRSAGEETPFEAASEVQALLASPPGSPERARIAVRLAKHAGDAAAALCAALPGPLEVPPGDLGSAEIDTWGPLPAALAAIGRPAARSLHAVLNDADPLRRRIAAALLARLGDPTSFGPLADRVYDSDAHVVAIALEALAAHRHDPEIRPVPEKLRRALHSGVADRPGRAARALGALRDVESIPTLIQVLETNDPGAAEAAAGALSAITLQRFGMSSHRWLAWWKENRGRGRAEWIFSGLTSPDRDVRADAAKELRAAAGAPVEYSEDMAPEARERAARAWASWWARSGKVL